MHGPCPASLLPSFDVPPLELYDVEMSWIYRETESKKWRVAFLAYDGAWNVRKTCLTPLRPASNMWQFGNRLNHFSSPRQSSLSTGQARSEKWNESKNIRMRFTLFLSFSVSCKTLSSNGIVLMFDKFHIGLCLMKLGFHLALPLSLPSYHFTMIFIDCATCTISL